MPVGPVGRIRDCHMLVVEAREVVVARCLFSKDQQGNMDAHYL